MAKERELKEKLGQAYKEEIYGVRGVRDRLSINRVQSDNDPLPTWACLKGYSFIDFRVDDSDPYALIDPEGQIIKVWPVKPPSLTELWEVLSTKA